MIRFISNKIAKIIGGAIDNTVIGGTTPAAGTFTEACADKDQNALTKVCIKNATSGTAAGTKLEMESGGSDGGVYLTSASYTASGAILADAMVIQSESSASGGLVLSAGGSNNLSLYTNGALGIKLNAIGNVGVGTASPSAGAIGGKVLHVQNSGATASVRVDRSDAAVAGTLSLTSGNTTNSIFSTGAKDLAFYANSTEVSRLDSSGHLLVGTTDNTPYNNSTSAGTGTSIGPNGQIWNHADNGDLGTWNRTGSDGSIFLINRDGSTVATVSVSSGTVTWGTFCGGHNSQFADNSQPEIERGTVISSIDELVEWRTVRWTQTVTETREINGEFQQVEIDLPKQADYYGAEPVGAVFTDDDGNEKTVHAKQADQLPKCEVSTAEGDKMVYGTFSHYDENGTPIIHSLGQTVVRVTGPIEAGDLLMSKGDGTACKWVESYGYAAILGKCRQGAPSAAQNDINLLAYTSMAG